MSEFIRTHEALFDELERQGVHCVDIGKLTRAVMQAQALIAPAQLAACSPSPYQRCESCE
jgi:hypothetical protein